MPKQAAKPASKTTAPKKPVRAATKSSASDTSKRSPAKKTSSPKKPQADVTRSSVATAVKPTKAKAAQAIAEPAAKAYTGPARVHADRERRTCIEILRDDIHVEYIALDIENGLDVGKALITEFDDRFKPMVDYPVEKAARLYIEYARGLGATESAMKSLGAIYPTTKEDLEMAAKKKSARAAAPVKTEKKTAAPKGKAPAEKSAPKGKAAAEKPAKAKPAKSAATGEKKSRGPTAASRFQELLLEKGAGGKCAHTDDQIFAKVQKEFNLDDGKRGYVKWYRNYLTKQGKNPPAAKE